MVLPKGKLMKTVLPITAIGLLTFACVEEYWPDLGTKYDRVLVVDGLVTDQPGPYTVKLSFSSTVDNAEYIPASGYQVQIFDDAGNNETLNETENGIYKTDSLGIQGIVGRKYRIEILSPDGRKYESDYEELRLSTGIDSVYAETEFHQTEALGHDLQGYQFFVDTHRAEMDTNYFVWRLESTFEYNANHTLKFLFDGQFHTPGKWDSLYTCWRTQNIQEVFTYKTEDLSEAKITRLPLHFVNTESKALSIRYSLLVKQMSVTKQAFEFWNDIGELEEEQETLYTRQPFQIRGNVLNHSNPDEPVLGYFMTAGFSQKRIFVNRPMGVRFYYNTECVLIVEELMVMLYLMRDQWPVLLTAIPVGPGLVPALPTRQRCIDCRKEKGGGGSISPPDFWVEY